MNDEMRSGLLLLGWKEKPSASCGPSSTGWPRLESFNLQLLVPVTSDEHAEADEAHEHAEQQHGADTWRTSTSTARKCAASGAADMITASMTTVWLSNGRAVGRCWSAIRALARP